MPNEMSNEPLDQHSKAMASEYRRYSLPLLQVEINRTQKRINSLQKDLGAISTEIARRFVEPLIAQMKAKEARSATIKAPDGFKIKGSVGKTVTWDGDALQTLAGNMDFTQATHYFKIKFTMAEAMFESIPPGEFKDKLTAARTTKDGQLKIEMIAPKQDNE